MKITNGKIVKYLFYCHSRTLCPVRMPSKSEEQIETFSGQNGKNSSPTDRWKKNPRWKHRHVRNNKEQKEGGKSKYWLYNIRIIMFYGVLI